MHTQEPKQIPNPKWRRRTLARAVAALLASMAVAVVADDGGNGEAGKPVLKSMSKLKTPTVAGYVDEAEHAYHLPDEVLRAQPGREWG